MRRFLRFYCVRIVAADPERFLTRLSESAIELIDMLWIDPLTVEFSVRRSQYLQTMELLNRYGINGSIKEKQGFLWRLSDIRKRLVLVAGMMLFVLVAVMLRERILFIQIEGNMHVPENQILYYAESAGVSFGVKSSKLRSEEIKNELLERMPELQWVGITASGCVATIDVKERSLQEPSSQRENGVSHLVAKRDGVVSEVSVLRGTPMVRPGESIKAGQILISGYTNCDRVIKAQNAAGEIFAYTLCTSEVVTPISACKYREPIKEYTCIKLRVGKKVINLCNHSGIQAGTCVKMYSEDYWTLPGGYQLPVCVVKICYTVHDTCYEPVVLETFDWVKDYAKNYLRSDMLAGQILGESLQVEKRNGAYILRGEYACHEMIGQVKYEEITEQYAEDN